MIRHNGCKKMSAIHFGKGGMGFGMAEGFTSKNLGRRSNICIPSSPGISDTFQLPFSPMYSTAKLSLAPTGSRQPVIDTSKYPT